MENQLETCLLEQWLGELLKYHAKDLKDIILGKSISICKAQLRTVNDTQAHIVLLIYLMFLKADLHLH